MPPVVFERRTERVNQRVIGATKVETSNPCIAVANSTSRVEQALRWRETELQRSDEAGDVSRSRTEGGQDRGFALQS